MPARPKKVAFKRAASESTVCRMVSGIFRVPAVETWRALGGALADADSARSLPWSMSDVVLYRWQEAVANVMFKASPKEELIQELVMAQGDVHLVQDSNLPGKEGLWLMVAEDAHLSDSSAAHALMCAPIKMVVNHVTFNSATYVVVAIQLLSCQNEL